ncbi:transposase, mutator-like family protein, partial [Leptospira mayottensis 200901122]
MRRIPRWEITQEILGMEKVTKSSKEILEQSIWKYLETETAVSNRRSFKKDRHVLPASMKIISMYSRGMTTREITQHLQEIYQVEVSADLISEVTDSVMTTVIEWQNRPLDKVYPILI